MHCLVNRADRPGCRWPETRCQRRPEKGMVPGHQGPRQKKKGRQNTPNPGSVDTIFPVGEKEPGLPTTAHTMGRKSNPNWGRESLGRRKRASEEVTTNHTITERRITDEKDRRKPFKAEKTNKDQDNWKKKATPNANDGHAPAFLHIIPEAGSSKTERIGIWKSDRRQQVIHHSQNARATKHPKTRPMHKENKTDRNDGKEGNQKPHAPNIR